MAEANNNMFGSIYLFVFWIIVLCAFVASNIVVLTLAIIYSQDPSEKKKKTSKILYIVALFLLVILVAVLAAVSATK